MSYKALNDMTEKKNPSFFPLVYVMTLPFSQFYNVLYKFNFDFSWGFKKIELFTKWEVPCKYEI